MNLFSFLGALETGFVFGLVALGVFLTFRVLRFPDLTVDGSFPMGGAVAAVMLVDGVDPWLAVFAGCLAGCLAGLVTAFLALKCGILHILASILTMIAAFSINIHIMGRPNIALLNVESVATFAQEAGLDALYARPLVCAAIALALVLAMGRFLASDFGLAVRATGANPRMARANGVHTNAMIFFGLALSNGLVAMGGALFAQMNGFADITSGVGTIVVGLASVILGETLIGATNIRIVVASCLLGAVAYRVAITLALNAGFLGLRPSDLNLVTALLVAAALVAPKARRWMKERKRRAP